MEKRSAADVWLRSSPKLLRWRTASREQRNEVIGALEEEANELRLRTPESAALFDAAVAVLELVAMEDALTLTQETLEEMARQQLKRFG